MFHSYEQIVAFIHKDQDCLKCVSVAYSVFMNHSKEVDEKKAMEFCQKVAIKLARIYNNKVVGVDHYAKVFTPATMSRIKQFVYDQSLATVKNC